MLVQEQATPAVDGLYPERDGIYFELCYLLPVTQIRLDGALYILHGASLNLGFLWTPGPAEEEAEAVTTPELWESGGGRSELPSLTVLVVSVGVKQGLNKASLFSIDGSGCEEEEV